MTASLLTIALGLTLDLLLALATRLLMPWTQEPLVNSFGDALRWLNDPLNWQGPQGCRT